MTEISLNLRNYNHKRIKAKLKGLSPVDYRTQAYVRIIFLSNFLGLALQVVSGLFSSWFLETKEGVQLSHRLRLNCTE
jgi:hypothetical protein